jgi:hypothetical protein
MKRIKSHIRSLWIHTSLAKLKMNQLFDPRFLQKIKNQLHLQTLPPKREKVDLAKKIPTKSNSPLRKLKSNKKTIMFQYKDKSRMNLKENKSPKT